MPPEDVQHGQNPRLQLLEGLKAASNVLVTVSNNPSVDQLAAAIGLTILLNKLDKHATAVFSGDVPSTIEFLHPETTIEKTTDSLRDFIIALDKAKADKLRYKVEDKVVKIFITPYKSSLSVHDLQFSQGDFNVDVVVALGVHQQADLDVAITAHGRILHDATVISVNNRLGGELGSIHWLDDKASSLSEMLASIADELKPGILDEQMSTALLTGIVAETDRFRNERTTPQTMSVSGKLMTSGANQQLIAAKLDGPEPIQRVTTPPPLPPQSPAITLPAVPPPPKDGAMEISHDAEEKKPPSEDLLDYSLHDGPRNSIHIDGDGQIHPAAGAFGAAPPPPPLPPVPTPLPPLPPASTEYERPSQHLILEPPTMGGTLTASYQMDGANTSSDPLSLPPVSSPLLQRENQISSSLAPVIDNDMDDETLAEIEEEVHSPHLKSLQDLSSPPVAATSPDNTPPPVDLARDAVNNAVAGAPPPLEPLIALSAQPLGQDLHIPELPPAPPLSPPSQPPATPSAWPSFLPPDNGPGPAPTDTTLPPSPPPPVPPPLMPPPAM